MAFSKGKQKDINLLPGLEQAAKLAKIKLFTAIISILIVVLLILAAAVVFYLNSSEVQKSKSISSQLVAQTAVWQQLSPTANKMNSLTAEIAQLKTLSQTNENFINSLDKARSRVPDGVTLLNVELKSLTTLSLQAQAADPAELDQFVAELKKESFFSQVTVTSLLKQTDKYSLNLDLAIKP